MTDDAAQQPGDDPGATVAGGPSRRDFLRLTGAAGAGLALVGARPFAAHAEPVRPTGVSLVAEAEATTLWYRTPADEGKIIEQGLPIGNGRLGGLVGCDPVDDFVYLTDASFWTGTRNDVLQDDGQFPYGPTDFGSFGLLAKVRVALPGHPPDAVTDYRRQLDLSNGVVSATYRHQGVRYRREIYASHPDDVVVIRLTQSGGGTHEGSVSLAGTHGETTAGAGTGLSFAGTLDNGLRYAAAVTVVGRAGTVRVEGSRITFAGCRELLVVVSGGTNYAPDPDRGYRDPAADPLAIARAKVAAAAKLPGTTLLTTHVADYHRLYNRMTIRLGESSKTQRALDSWSRITVRHTDPSQPDPELEAAYLQFGRYLTITGSRDSLPLNLQGLWLHNNTPDWYSDYHTDINVQMNYWLADRAGLGECFHALADYCLSQLPSWTAQTGRLFNDPRNRFRNSSGRVAGWTVAFSTNIHGGLGWWWHPAGNAWLCNSLWQHYEFTQDRAYLEKIYPVLRGAAEFWQARLITATVTDPETGASREVLVDDADWSPEHGPQDAKGITYAQELAWDLFGQIGTAAARLGRDGAFAETVTALRARLHLPRVSPKTGWLEEWMSPDNLGEQTHRHLSPLIGFFPGDRINTDTAGDELLDGVRELLTARGMDSFGWACAWRSLCWARLREAEKAYQLYLTVLRPSMNNGNGTAANFFDMYSQGDRTIFQIDANLGGAAAVLEMLLYSRPGVIELLPALPAAWAADGEVTGVGARGGFEVDLRWRGGRATSATVRSVGGTATELRHGSWRRDITLRPGESITVTPGR
ncbi:glycoside hydrolase N-terminal domain-containing protein [Micromonospora sp. NPDC049559]|uniref:glycosyl hydrolase family 95 catalytic domain-containing protein n=1 Tax=Micromonospora sp. NPDC049559 TaxID=3155923 RepID=UPI003420683B